MPGALGKGQFMMGGSPVWFMHGMSIVVTPRFCAVTSDFISASPLSPPNLQIVLVYLQSPGTQAFMPLISKAV